MKSEFSYRSFLFPFLIVALIAVCINILVAHYPIKIADLRIVDYFMVLLFMLTLIWLTYFEFYRKMISVKLTHDSLRVQKLFFLNKKYNSTDLISYSTSINTTKLGNFEETIVVTKDRSKIILAEFFLKNYREIKMEVTKNLNYVGGAQKYP